MIRAQVLIQKPSDFIERCEVNAGYCLIMHKQEFILQFTHSHPRKEALGKEAVPQASPV